MIDLKTAKPGDVFKLFSMQNLDDMTDADLFVLEECELEPTARLSSLDRGASVRGTVNVELEGLQPIEKFDEATIKKMFQLLARRICLLREALILGKEELANVKLELADMKIELADMKIEKAVLKEEANA